MGVSVYKSRTSKEIDEIFHGVEEDSKPWGFPNLSPRNLGGLEFLNLCFYLPLQNNPRVPIP